MNHIGISDNSGWKAVFSTAIGRVVNSGMVAELDATLIRQKMDLEISPAEVKGTEILR